MPQALEPGVANLWHACQIVSGTPLDTFVELLFSSLKIAYHKKFKNHRVG